MTEAQKAVKYWQVKSSPAEWATKIIRLDVYSGFFECADGSRFLVTFKCNKIQLAN